MDAIHYEALRKMFEARRLHPWEPEHALFIKGEIAKLKVTEPKDAKSYEEFYDNKMKEWEATPDDPIVESKVPAATFNTLPLPEFPVETLIEEVMETPAAEPVEIVKKRKYAKKNPSPN